MGLFLDIYDPETKQLCSFDKISIENKISYLMYISICAAILCMWKHILKHYDMIEPIDIEPIHQRLGVAKPPSKRIYWELIDKTTKTQTANKCIWENDLNIKMTDDNWYNLFLQFLKNVKPTKLRDFQYRLLNRAITTNVIRNKWDKNIDPECTLCKKEKETIIHFMCECKTVQSLWNALYKLMKIMLEVRLQLTKGLIICNNYQGKKKDMVNLLIAITKQFIYAAKCKNELPIFTNLMAKLYKWYQADKMFAYENNKVKQFRKKWQDIYY